jgi:hypothetical protein
LSFLGWLHLALGNSIPVQIENIAVNFTQLKRELLQIGVIGLGVQHLFQRQYEFDPSLAKRQQSVTI